MKCVGLYVGIMGLTEFCKTAVVGDTSAVKQKKNNSNFSNTGDDTMDSTCTDTKQIHNIILKELTHIFRIQAEANINCIYIC